MIFYVKDEIGIEEYRKCYPSGSNPGRFYGTTKVHKLKLDETDKIGKLPFRQIISNVGTAAHKTGQHLCRLLAPLGNPEYTVKNTKEFVEKIRQTKAPDGYQMVSFDVVSPFTNVPLKRQSISFYGKFTSKKESKLRYPDIKWRNY